MSNAVAVVRPSDVVADDWSQERIDFIRKTYCGGAPDATAATFLELCRRRRLSPEEKHVYLTKRGNDWVIQTGIDGYRLIADRTGRYVGSDDPVYDTEEAAQPGKATVTVWKLVQGQRCPFTASARWSEYAPQDQRMAFMWRKMPYLMLAKTAEALALRKAFPADLSNIYTDAEMDQAGPRDEPPPSPRPAAIRPTVEVVDMETGEILPEVVSHDNITATDTTTPVTDPIPPAARRRAAQHATAPPKEYDPDADDGEAVNLGALHGDAAYLGWDHDKLHKEAFGEYGVSSLTELTREQVGRWRRNLAPLVKAAIDAARALPVVEDSGIDITPAEAVAAVFRERMEEAPTLGHLQAIAPEIASAKIEHPDLDTEMLGSVYRTRRDSFVAALKAD